MSIVHTPSLEALDGSHTLPTKDLHLRTAKAYANLDPGTNSYAVRGGNNISSTTDSGVVVDIKVINGFTSYCVASGGSNRNTAGNGRLMMFDMSPNGTLDTFNGCGRRISDGVGTDDFPSSFALYGELA